MIANAIRRSTKVTRGPLDNFWYRPASRATSSGVMVDDSKALAVATFWAALRVISDTIGAMPWVLYDRISEEEKVRATQSDLYTTIHDKPNRWQSPIEWKSLGVGHLILRGNFYNLIVPKSNKWPYPSFIPLNPDRMEVSQDDSNVYYSYKYADGRTEHYPHERILHVKLLSTDGLVGMSPLTYAADVLGNQISRTQHTGALFAGGGFLKYYLSTDKHINEDGVKNFRREWRDLHGNPKVFEPPILEDGMQIHTLGMSNTDAQTLEMMKFGAYEVCQFLGVPPHLVFLLDRATFSNIEQQSLEFLTIHLNPWLVRFEQALQLHVENDQFSEFLRESIVRADIKSRYESYAKSTGGKGWATQNEIRRIENLPPIDGGDELPKAPNESIKPSSSNITEAQSELILPTIEESSRTESVDLTPLIADVAERIVSRETKGLGARAGKAEGDRETFDTWAADWYCRHTEFVARALIPIWTVAGLPGDDAATAADEYCRQSLTALDGQPVGEVLADWKKTKAAALAETLEEKLTCTNES